jgi:hypothetical protein
MRVDYSLLQLYIGQVAVGVRYLQKILTLASY